MESSGRKIVKAIYLLLERYHRLFGLEVYSFSHGSFGPGYFGFQIAAHRCWWGRDLRDANYASPTTPNGTYGPLVGYWYMASIPAWAAGHQLTFRNWEKARTHEIVSWYEDSLNLHQLFEANARAIQEWRQNYTVDEAEKYLLMMNLAGLFASARETFPLTPVQSFSDYDSHADQKAADIMRRLSLEPDYEPCCAFGLDGSFIGRNGKAVAGERMIDLWDSYVAGSSSAELLDMLDRASDA